MKRNYGYELAKETPENSFFLFIRNLCRVMPYGLIWGSISAVFCFFWLSYEGTLVNALSYPLMYLKNSVKQTKQTAEEIGYLNWYFSALDQQFYISIGVMITIFIVVWIYLIKKWNRVSCKENQDAWRSGSRLCTAKEIHHEIKTNFKTKMGNLITFGIQNIKVPEPLQYTHFSFAGASGSGKTTAINYLLEQIRSYNHKAVIFDVGGGYYSRFGRPEDKILSLYDKRSEAWDFWAEDTTPDFFAAALVEEDRYNKFFSPAARSLLESLIQINSSTAELWDDFHRSDSDLINKLKAFDQMSERILGVPGSNQAAGVLATAALKFSFLKDLNHWPSSKPKFSILDWVKSDDPGWLFLIVKDEDIEISNPLMRLWFDLATLGAIRRDEYQDHRHFWLLIDELKTAGKLPTLPKILDRGRKYKTTVVCGYQAESQLEEVYGDKDAKSMRQGFQNKFVFRCADEESAKVASTYFGEAEFEQTVESVTFDRNKNDHKAGIATKIVKKPIVPYSKIMSLPDGTAFFRLGPLNPSTVKFHLKGWPRINVSADCVRPPLKRNNTPDKDPEQIKIDHETKNVGPEEKEDCQKTEISKTSKECDPLDI